jgi:DNA-binding SARP family transcriptional activator
MSMLFLRTFGGLSLELDGQPVPELTGSRKALILLAILAADGPIGRDRLLTLLWPESDDERARGSLKQTLHLIRRALTAADLVSGHAELQLNQAYIQSDVDEFRRALSARDYQAAVQRYRGPFLDAVHTPNAPEFERWVDQRREDFLHQYAHTLEELAERAEAQGDFAEAVSWWRKRQAVDPTNGMVAARLIRALDAIGDRGAALRHARMHEIILRDDFDLPADPNVQALAEELRTTQPPVAEVTLERLAARLPELVASSSRQRTFIRLVSATMLLVLLVGGGMVAALNLTRRPSLQVNELTPGDRAQAYEYLLKGRQLLQQKSVQAAIDAKSYFNQAIALDPTLTDAYVALGEVELAPGLSDPEPRLQRAQQAAQRALASDSASVSAHTLMLWVKTLYERDFEGAELHFRKAYALDPNNAWLHNAYAVYTQTVYGAEASLRVMLRAYELRPNVTANVVHVGNRYLMMGKTTEAMRYYNAALQRDTAFFMTHWARGRVFLQTGQYDSARIAFSRPGTDIMGIHQEAFVGYTHARAGNEREARRVLDALLEKRARGGYVAPTDVAIIYIGLGEYEKALDWLEELVEHPSRIFLKADPIFDPLRADPRFQHLLRALGLLANNRSSARQP